MVVSGIYEGGWFFEAIRSTSLDAVRIHSKLDERPRLMATSRVDGVKGRRERTG